MENGIQTLLMRCEVKTEKAMLLEQNSSEREVSVWERWGQSAFEKHPLPVCWFSDWSHRDGLLSPIQILGCRHRSPPGKPPLMLYRWEGDQRKRNEGLTTLEGFQDGFHNCKPVWAKHDAQPQSSITRIAPVHKIHNDFMHFFIPIIHFVGDVFNIYYNQWNNQIKMQEIPN